MFNLISLNAINVINLDSKLSIICVVYHLVSVEANNLMKIIPIHLFCILSSPSVIVILRLLKNLIGFVVTETKYSFLFLNDVIFLLNPIFITYNL